MRMTLFTLGRNAAFCLIAAGAAVLPGTAMAGPAVEACAAEAAGPYEKGYESTGKLGTEVNVDAALLACEAAVVAEPQSTSAKAWLARSYFLVKRYADAVPLAELAAAAGNPMAQQLLGDIFMDGLGGVPADMVRGIALLTQSAEAGYALGLNSLAYSYENGQGVAQDLPRAAKLYEAAAAQGEINALINLGMLYTNGSGVAQDHERAFALFMQAAETGDAVGLNNVGNSYEAGEGVAQDYGKAMEWYLKAVEAGEPLAAANIANLYIEGWGVAQDYAEARRWAEKAVAGEDAFGQFLLGRIHEEGLGIPADLARARALYEESAAGGDVDAIAALERLGGQ